jgi:hypothetical protein
MKYETSKNRLQELAGLVVEADAPEAAERQEIMDKVIPAVSAWLDDAKTLPGFTDSQRLENAIETIAIQICIDVADEFGLLSDMRTRERVRSLADKIKAATSIDQAKQLMIVALQAILDLANNKPAAVREDYSTMSLKSNIDQKWKTADDMAGDMQQWLSGVYSSGGEDMYEEVMNILAQLADNFDPSDEM